MNIIVKNLSYTHPDREILFQNLSFSFNKGEKIALIGHNGSGKSTILRILAGILRPSAGEIIAEQQPYYVPQHFGQYNDLTLSEALGIKKKLDALHAILQGNTETEHFTNLNDDWDIEERGRAALNSRGIGYLTFSRKMDTLSGGEKTKVFLSGIAIHNPAIILFDEPTNHLDWDNRIRLYKYIEMSKAGLLVVSHDRTLLNLLEKIYEIEDQKITVYGGNYEFYKMQKDEKNDALKEQVAEKEKTLRKAKQAARKMEEQKQKLDARGKGKQMQEGTPRIMLNQLRNKAENSTSKLKDVHIDKMANISQELKNLKTQLADTQMLKLEVRNADLHQGKILATAQNVNYQYDEKVLWKTPLNFQMVSGERILISGRNGIGKSTLVKLILGNLVPTTGKLEKNDFRALYIDQEYALIENQLTLLEQLERFNNRHLREHELKILLHRFLFPMDTWEKKCSLLSGGEKMRLLFCCLTVNDNVPDVFILDEPTNNLDIQSLGIVTSVVKQYQGTVLLISHDRYFIDEIGVDKEITLI